MPAKKKTPKINISVQFDEAITWAHKRVSVLPTEYYSHKQNEARARAFTVSGLASVEQIERVRLSLQKALDTGQSLKTWQQGLSSDVLSLPRFRRETIFRNAMQNAYAAGRWDQATRNRAIRPILMYDAINDSRTRPSHKALDGFMARIVDPVWKRIHPPGGHNCRCTTITLTEKQARDRGWSGTPSAPKGEPDPGWDYNPGEVYGEKLLELEKRAVDALPMAPTQAVQKRRMIEEAKDRARTYVLGQSDSAGREYGVVVDPDSGTFRATYRGEKNYIAMPHTDDDILKGSIFFHNHPSSSSLSSADLRVAVHYGMREMHAVGLDGSRYMARTPDYSNKEESMLQYKLDLRLVEVAVEKELYVAIRPLVSSGKMTTDQANLLHTGLVNHGMAIAGLIVYTVLATGAGYVEMVRAVTGILDIDALRRRVEVAARGVKLLRKHKIEDH